MSLFSINYGKQKQGLIANREQVPVNVPDDWWNQSWRKRIQFTISDTTIQPTTDVEIFLHRTIPELIGTNIDELRFIHTNQELDFDIVKFNSATGELFVYILPQGTTTGSQYYIYFGNPTATQSPQIHPLPYHAHFTFLNFENSVVDPTGHFDYNNYSGTNPTIRPIPYVDGINSRAIEFNASPLVDTYLKSNLHSRVTNHDRHFVLHAIVKKDPNPTTGGIIELSDGQVNSKALLFIQGNRWFFRVQLDSGQLFTVVDDIPISNDWEFIAGVYDYIAHSISLYRNGTLVNTLNLPPGTVVLQNQDVEGFITIGALTDGIYPFHGSMDNVGWMRVTREDRAIHLMYRNSFFNDAFWTLSDLESI